MDAKSLLSCDSIPTAWYLLDAKEHIADCNLTFAELLGYPREELLGTHPLTYYLRSEDRLDEDQRERDQEGSYEGVIWLRTKDGDAIAVLDKNRILDHEGTRYVFGVLSEVTGLELSRKEALLFRKRKESVWNAVSDILFQLGEDLCFTDANAMALKTYDLTIQEFVGSGLEAIVDRPFLQEAEMAMSELLNHPGEELQTLVNTRTRTGEVRVLNVLISCIEVDGKRYLEGTGRDVTEDFRRQRALESQNRILEEMLATIPGMLVLMDHEGAIKHCNKRFEDFLRIKEADWDGKYLLDFFSESEQVEGWARVQNDLNLMRPTHVTLRTKRGSFRRVQLHWSVLDPEAPRRAYVAYVEDLGEDRRQRQREEILTAWRHHALEGDSLEEQWPVLMEETRRILGTELVEVWFGKDGSFRYKAGSCSPDLPTKKAMSLASRIEMDWPLGVYGERLRRDGIVALEEIHEDVAGVRTDNLRGAGFQSMAVVRLTELDAGELLLRISSKQALGGELGRIFQPIRATLGDLIQRAMAQAEVKAQGQILQQQLDASLEAVLILNSEGQILDLNWKFLELCGLERTPNKSGWEAYLERSEDPGLRVSIRQLYQDRSMNRSDRVQLGTSTYSRRSVPLVMPDGSAGGRIWYFQEVSGEAAED